MKTDTLKEVIHPSLFQVTFCEELDRKGWCLFRLQAELDNFHFDDLHSLYTGSRGPTKGELGEICKAMGVKEIRFKKTRDQLERKMIKDSNRNNSSLNKLSLELDKAKRDLLSLSAALRLRVKQVERLKNERRGLKNQLESFVHDTRDVIFRGSIAEHS